jgi:hypothetical protein
MPENETYEQDAFRRRIYDQIVVGPRSNRPATEQCVEKTLQARRAKGKAVRNGYLAAAQWFALATQEKRWRRG